ncbi:uncharacterized protein BDZ99DRAFT_527290 [Mytilinidion resinicola]|uniref:Uncharacterized protein n=1 Tax=Mytilinidion resinicola TaxID=574789 RepID=A0A6A6Y3G4_9PEZI|nr:uncharacterized protein BDZ99DRAFT_527290 [Mytilinidion resinicola]KAF2802564.1 hypothetical protein BDZ99DRAFT_527290 [Mytilinidion resinicola]
MERHKRGREPDEGDDVEEIPRSEPADGQNGKPLLQIHRDGNESLKTHAKHVKISSAFNDIEVTVQFDSNSEVRVHLNSHSSVKPYIKDKGNLNFEDESFIVRASSHQYRPYIFPFLKLPAEIRIMIYELVLGTERIGWLSQHRGKDSQAFCKPIGSCLGTARPLMSLYQQIRSEVGAIAFQGFQVTRFNFDCCANLPKPLQNAL